MNTYEEVPLPEDTNLIGSKWVFIRKDDLPIEERYRVRLCAKGFSQVAEEDYLDTFAPTARPTTLRAVIHEAFNKDYIIEALDFNTAFLNAELDVPNYMKPPEGCPPKVLGNVLKLNKSLYGLKQSSKLWNEMFRTG